jgi:predicted O-methyltransferase YrrM
MSNFIFRIKTYLNYQLNKKGPHGIHSPFIYEFSTKVIRDRSRHPAYEKILKAKKYMLSNRNVIETVDFGSGAGNKSFSTYRVRVSELAKSRSSAFKYYALLHRIVAFYKPAHIMEFGTSTGLSAISMALGNPDAHILSMEGCASVAHVAEGIFHRFNISSVELSIGNFNNVLAANLQKSEKLDLVFFDGNHRKEPTLDYFFHCMTKIDENSIFIFDDIHWSPEMEEAWEAIKAHKEVTLSVDLFQFGIVFFRKGVEKQHFVLSM